MFEADKILCFVVAAIFFLLYNNRQSNDFKLLSVCFSFLFSSFRYHGYISAALVLGGVDLNGPTLHTVYPHGSTDKLPYVTMGKKVAGLTCCLYIP